MRADLIAFVHTTVRGVVPVTADFHDAARKVDVDAQLVARRPWVKLYMPSEEGDDHPVETLLVTLDCGAIHPETARALAEEVRSGLSGSKRSPSPFRRMRIVALDEGNFHRVQLSYRLRRPAI